MFHLKKESASEATMGKAVSKRKPATQGEIIAQASRVSPRW